MLASELLSGVIRRFQVRILGRFKGNCWPNGKAPDYGLPIVLHFDVCTTLMEEDAVRDAERIDIMFCSIYLVLLYE